MIEISQQEFNNLHQLTPKRIYFMDSTVSYLKRDNDSGYYGKLNFPFKETIQKIFEKETNFKLFDNKNDLFNKTSVWLSIKDKSNFDTIEEWINAQNTTVFIRSLLLLCIALDVNVDFDNKVKTNIGVLEDKGKRNQNKEAIDALVDLLYRKIKDNVFYQNASYIAAVPANKNEKFNLPTLLAKKVAEKLNCQDITDYFVYQNLKQPLKSTKISDKWQELEQANLRFEQRNLKIKDVILLDDKYQSGTTLHYVASKLQQVGFNTIYGLVVIKTMRDDDNQ